MSPTSRSPAGPTLPGLVSQHILAGAGHWLQQERPEEVSRLLLDWLVPLRDLSPSALVSPSEAI
jgi:pimeloyl-ACP methyl ester carboxylesterase